MSRKGSIVVESRLVGALTALVGLLAIGAAPAVARWSAPRTVSSSRAGFGKVALATDARGDAAFASAGESDVGPVQTRAALNVALLSTRGPSVKRTLWRSGDALVGDVVVALDARGELTVAWIAAARGRNGETLAPHTIRSAYRTPSGKWSPTEIVGHSGPFLSADLRLAVAPNGETLATWRAHTKRAPGVAAAWRKPGHRFGPETAVSRAKSATMTDPTSLFDSSGAAHIYGTVGCGRLIRSCATMVSTAPRSHRFGTPLLIAPAPAEFPVVSFSAPGRALIAWEAGDYQDLEPSFAAPYARVSEASADRSRGRHGASVGVEADSQHGDFVPASRAFYRVRCGVRCESIAAMSFLGERQWRLASETARPLRSPSGRSIALGRSARRRAAFRARMPQAERVLFYRGIPCHCGSGCCVRVPEPRPGRCAG